MNFVLLSAISGAVGVVGVSNQMVDPLSFFWSVLHQMFTNINQEQKNICNQFSADTKKHFFIGVSKQMADPLSLFRNEFHLMLKHI